MYHVDDYVAEQVTRSARHPTRIQNDYLKAMRVTRDIVWASGLSGVRAKSISDPGPVRLSSFPTTIAGGQEARGSSARRPLNERRFVKVSLLTGSSHRGRRKLGHDDTERITVITARDLWSKS
ncbi:hypothetical protein PanWU01x14_230890 [Parasponia andersonii]|uniref:Uncharacterized protein n=1 Tax=Parasponia andersonii TaxID=3476 RepID=A0A2P5BKJ1_PARAD|nr:hypothetical protein PanWU01x14_230890 [Parasponia andersonii]